jgi:DNA (cytosine-5)-methyltransferase 1
MKYASVCSGIEAASMAWEPLGFQPVWFSEVAPFPSAVLAHHWPAVPNLGDMTRLYEKETYLNTDFDVLVGGTPCQGFSLAGKRGGMDDERSKLVWHFLRILDEKRPRWMVWENVPGVLSSWSDAEAGKDGTVWQTNDFDQFTAALRQLGYGLAMRVLDAQYSDLAQRRERVFVVGYLGDWRSASAVLFEQHSFGWHPAPGRGKGKEVATDVASCLTSSVSGYTGTVRDGNPNIVAEVADTLMGKNGVRLIDQAQALVVNEVVGTICIEGPNNGQGYFGEQLVVHQNTLAAFSGERQTEVAANLLSHGVRGDLETETFLVEETANCLTSSAHKGGQSTAGNNPGMVNPVICYDTTQITSPQNGSTGSVEQCQTNQVNANGSNVKDVFAVSTPRLKVRRLTPIEYERLMGFPDDHTKVPYRGKPAELCPDGPRYQACGNSIAVPLLRWIGKRMAMVDAIVNPKS